MLVEIPLINNGEPLNEPTLNRAIVKIKENIEDLYKKYAALSATSEAVPETLVLRDENATAKFGEPTEGDHPVRLVDLHRAHPTGSVISFVGNVAPTEEGFMFAHGQEIDRITYAKLFGLIGTTYGEGDGSTTFNLPDTRGEFIRGLDNGRGIDSGRVLGSNQSDEFRSHGHTASIGGSGSHGHSGSTSAAGGHSHQSPTADSSPPSSSSTYEVPGSQNNSAFSGYDYLYAAPTSSSGVHNHTFSVSGGEHSHSVSVGSRGGSETRPRNLAMNYIIKVI